MSNEILRILDASANRAREALRVIEDFARFILNDAQIAERVKLQRHALGAALAALPEFALLAARDIDGDVGREIKAPGELTRSDAIAVLRAACGRLSEAARALGEYGKLLSPALAAQAEALRYEAYSLESLLLQRGEPRRRFRAVRLYVLITEALCRGHWLNIAEAALLGGATCLQLREKHLSDSELLRRAQALRALTRAHAALLIINDRADLARLVGADGVHVGQDDLPVAEARRIAGAQLLIGKSTHNAAQFQAAAAEAPDYLALGPMYASSTKPQAELAGPVLLRELCGSAREPVVAIGGIAAANAAEIASCGAACVCVCSAVIAAADPQTAAREILKVFEAGAALRSAS